MCIIIANCIDTANYLMLTKQSTKLRLHCINLLPLPEVHLSSMQLSLSLYLPRQSLREREREKIALSYI